MPTRDRSQSEAAEGSGANSAATAPDHTRTPSPPQLVAPTAIQQHVVSDGGEMVLSSVAADTVSEEGVDSPRRRARTPNRDAQFSNSYSLSIGEHSQHAEQPSPAVGAPVASEMACTATALMERAEAMFLRHFGGLTTTRGG